MQYLHTMLRVSDLDSALSFYCGGLGLVETRKYERPIIGPRRMARRRPLPAVVISVIWPIRLRTSMNFAPIYRTAA